LNKESSSSFVKLITESSIHLPLELSLNLFYMREKKREREERGERRKR